MWNIYQNQIFLDQAKLPPLWPQVLMFGVPPFPGRQSLWWLGRCNRYNHQHHEDHCDHNTADHGDVELSSHQNLSSTLSALLSSSGLPMVEQQSQEQPVSRGMGEGPGSNPITSIFVFVFVFVSVFVFVFTPNIPALWSRQLQARRKCLQLLPEIPSLQPVDLLLGISHITILQYKILDIRSWYHIII